MFDAIRNWFEVRAAMKDARRIRTGQATLNSIIVIDKLTHADEMVRAGQTDYATAIIDEMLERYPSEVADLPATISILIELHRLDEAEVMAEQGMQRNPDSRDFARLHAHIADHRGDVPERLRRWRAFRRRYPAYGLSFRMEANALLAAGEDAAAERLLEEGARVVNDDVGLAIDYARRAEARRDWPEALRRWTVVRDGFEHSSGAVKVAETLIEQGLHDQAEAELLAARSRFPLEPKIVEDLAALAERRGNLDGALACWAELRRDLPHVTRGYTETARLLRARGDTASADEMIVAAATRAPQDRELQYAYAALAEGAGDWAEASRRWMAVRQRFPKDTTSIAREAAALRQLGLPDEAEALLASALQRFPAAADIYQAYAELAEARGDLSLAAQRWRAVVAAEPGVWWTHTELARALGRLGDIAAADETLAAAIARLPDEPILYADHAELAGRGGRTDDAAARWASARARFGLVPMLARREADWLRDQGRLDEAKALLEAAHQQAPADVDLLKALAQVASRQGDFARAEAWWRAVLIQQPQLADAHSALALALRRLDRADDADALLAQAIALYPGNFTLAAAWARDAADRQDWPEARRRWAVVGERFPAEGHPWWQEGIALREAGLMEEARAHFQAGAERFPTDPSFPHDLGLLAQGRGDHADAERWWRRYTELVPGNLWGWVNVLTELRHQGRAADAEAMTAGLEQKFAATPVWLQTRANWARQGKDWPEAERLAALLQERFPTAWQGLHAQAMIAADRDRLDEAQAILLRGAERHPDVVDFCIELARLAERRHDLAEAERWWRRMVRMRSGVGWAWSALADNLVRQDLPEVAEAVLLQAAAALPDEPAHLVRWAALAEPRSDWPEAERRYRVVQLRMPENPQAPRGLAWAILRQGRPAEAARILQAANRRQPNVAGHAHDLAQMAAQAGNLAEAAHWWGAATAAQPLAGWALGALALTLELQGRAAEADDRLRAAIEAQPTSRALHHEYARAADRRGDRRLAVQRWAAATDRFADDPVALHGHAVALAEAGDPDAALRMLQDGAARLPGQRSFERAIGQIGAGVRDPAAIMRAAAIMPPVRLADDADADLPTIQRAVERFTGMPIRAFIMGFETLGNSCEFGFVQRYCGAEPLGLMRFAGMSAADMARGISTEFAGIGKHLSAHGDEGWDITDEDYRMTYHTFRPLTEPAETLLKSEPRRLRFLANKLLRDIDDGEKTFLLWKTFIGISQAEAQPVIDAVHARNPRANVVFITPDSPFGYAEPLAPGLYRGHHRALSHAAEQGVPDMQGWLEMLVNVWALNRTAQSAPPRAAASPASPIGERVPSTA
jgi:tetratricopeptide (TPR) repeat protein